MKEDETQISKLKKSPFFENLKNINPKYSLIGCDSTWKTSRNSEYCQKSDTFIIDKIDKFSIRKGANGDLRLGCNKENDLQIVDGSSPNLENSISQSECSDTSRSISSDHTKTSLNVLKVDSDEKIFHNNETETCNDEIIIFERTEYKCPKVRVEKTRNIPRSVKVQRVLNALRICLIIVLLLWSILRANESHILQNYFKIKQKRQPTNYEVSLLFIKNVCRMIFSGVEFLIVI